MNDQLVIHLTGASLTLRQALLKLHVNDQLVINCNDSHQPYLILVCV